MAHSVETLGKAHRERLDHLEQIINSGLRAFVRVGEALTEIRREHYYRAEHATFESYCRDRWEMSGTQAYRLIDAAAVVAIIASPNGEKIPPPVNEAQARALAPLKAEPEAVRRVWADVRSRHGENVTADAVRAAVRDAQAKKPPSEPHPPQTLKQRPGWQLIHGGPSEVGATLDADSVGAIITDPPELNDVTAGDYQALMELAERVLGDGGSLAVLSGQSWLMATLAMLEGFPGLDFRWVLAYRSATGVRPDYTSHARTFWRPVVWATKGNYRGDWVDDITAEGKDGLRQLVEQLTLPEALVLDPFCGKAPIGFRVVNLGRRYIGVDRDPVSLAEARRMAEL